MMSSVPAEPNNPYVGPRAFRQGEPLYGRERETNHLINLILAERIVLLYSPSGAGKTSIIQAALVPRLQQMKFNVLPVVRVNLQPSPNSYGAGNGAANRYVSSAILSLDEGLPDEQSLPPEELAGLSLADYLERRPHPEKYSGIEILFFDQFEEILLLDPTDQEAKQEFFRQVGEALNLPSRWALFSMREEFVTALDPFLLPIPNRFSCTFRLNLLAKENALDAIQKPARQAGVEFETAAAEKLADDLRRVRVQRPDGATEVHLGPYVEPVQLQVVCHRLWEAPRPAPGRISEHDLQTFGEVDQSLADYYAAQTAAAAAATGVSERSIREWVDRQLITEQGVRGTVRMGRGQSGGMANRAIWRLIDAHLVRSEKRGGATWFELAHDRLLAPVREDNTEWFNTHLHPVQRQADLWRRQGRPESLLLRPKDFAEAEGWAAAHGEELLPDEGEYLKASRTVIQREQRARRLTRLIAVLGAAALVLAVIAFLAYLQAQSARREAEFQARLARSGQLAAMAQDGLDWFPLRSVLLAVEAVRTTTQAGEPPLPAAEEALRAALQDPRGHLLAGQTAQVTHLALSPDGRWLAAAGDDLTTRLWDLQARDPSAEPFLLTGHRGQITALAFSPEGRWLATAGEDTDIHLWDLTTPSLPGTPLVLSGHEGLVSALAFSPDGRRLASGSVDTTARLWDLRSGSPSDPAPDPIVLSGHANFVTTLAFSPDGRWLATGSGDMTARLWDLAGGRSLALSGHERQVSALAFSPDGRWLATGSADRTARLWDLQSRNPAASPAVLGGHLGELTTLAFSPDGAWLATASRDTTVRLWAVGTEAAGNSPMVLTGHTGPVTGLAFSPDGLQLAAAGEDHTTRLWTLQAPSLWTSAGVLRGHDQAVTGLAFSSDGRQLATGSRDASVRLWDLAGSLSAAPTLTDPRLLDGHTAAVQDLIFHPAGQRLVSGSADATAIVWALDEAQAVRSQLTLPVSQGPVSNLALSPDGRWLAAAASGAETGVALWDLTASDPAAGHLTLQGHESWVRDLAFSPDSRWLAAAGQDTTTRLWDLTGSLPASPALNLLGHTAEVTALAFSPDGRYLATGSGDASIRLWDLQSANSTGTAPGAAALTGHEGPITAVAFSPDGRWLATGSVDRTTRLWDLQAANPADSPRLLSGHTSWIETLTFSPDGRWLATGSGDATARLWDLSANDPTAGPIVLRSHAAFITRLAFSPDSRFLASGSEDATVRLWSLEAGRAGAGPVILSGYSGPITGLAFSPDGRWLAAGSEDSTIRLFRVELEDLLDLACRSVGRNFTQEEWLALFPGAEYRKTCQQWPEGQ